MPLLTLGPPAGEMSALIEAVRAGPRLAPSRPGR